MTPEHYEYLLQLPLVLHLPTLNTIVAHAGLLPYDSTVSPDALSQPLIAANASVSITSTTEELSILLDVPQNTDPLTLTTMRNVNDGKPVKGTKKGVPWSEIWNDEMGRCDAGGASGLKYMPVIVIYGHAGELDCHKFKSQS